MKIYTRTGDEGGSSLFDGSRHKKSDPRFHVLGELDRLNVILGRCGSDLQAEIFSLSSELALAESEIDWYGRVSEIESQIDELSSKLPELKNFILPGGCELALNYHEARVQTRYVERLLVELKDVDASILKYVNRLSDLFFVLARSANLEAGVEEVIWD